MAYPFLRVDEAGARYKYGAPLNLSSKHLAMLDTANKNL
jgi:hypothetical protein